MITKKKLRVNEDARRRSILDGVDTNDDGEIVVAGDAKTNLLDDAGTDENDSDGRKTNLKLIGKTNKKRNFQQSLHW